jgi:hypothetical protein
MNFEKNTLEPQSFSVVNVRKALNVLILAVALTFSGMLSASTEPAKKIAEHSDSSVCKKVSNLLKNPSFEVENDLSATVLITVNQENELVVLSVDSDHETFESYIKSRLNYEKLDASFIGKGRTFKVPVRLKSI